MFQEKLFTEAINKPWQGEFGLIPFWAGIGMRALIEAYEKTKDPEIPPIIENAVNQLWTLMWNDKIGGFRYNSATCPVGNADCVLPGLNPLIAPAYAWVYMRTGNTTIRDRGDTIFKEGVRQSHNASAGGGCSFGSCKGAYLWYGKQFNQSYWWSFDYVTWRKADVKQDGKP
jgi:hypothetical protein